MLTIAYIDPIATRAARQKELMDRYFFVCACSACVSPSDAMSALTSGGEGEEEDGSEDAETVDSMLHGEPVLRETRGKEQRGRMHNIAEVKEEQATTKHYLHTLRISSVATACTHGGSYTRSHCASRTAPHGCSDCGSALE